MYSDPIVEEVREAGAKLAEKAGYDIHAFFRLLREAERDYKKPLINTPPVASEATQKSSDHRSQ